MFKVSTSLNLTGSVVRIKATQDNIFALTNQYTYAIYDKKTLAILKNKKISNNFQSKHIYNKSFAISENFDLFVTTPDVTKSFLLKYNDSLSKEATISLSKKDIYCSSFNHKADTLAIGGEDGRVFFYSIKEKQVVKSLPTRSDFISNINFSKDDKFVAISSFDKTIAIYSFYTESQIAFIECDDVVEASMFFENNSKLLIATRDKKYSMYHIETGIQTKYPFEFEEWPTAMVEINDRYSVVGDRGNSLYVIDNQKYSILPILKLDNKGIVSMEIDGGHLYVAFVDGEIKIIDIYDDLEEFKLSLKLHDFSKASKLIEKNIFLITDEVVRKFDEEWPNILSHARNLLATNQEKEAKSMVQPFFFDLEKEEEFLLCFGGIEYYKMFSRFIEEKKYVAAFKLADQYEYLKKSKDFESIEKYFVKIFQHCKQLFKKGDLESVSAAKKILLSYSQIPSKRILVNNLALRHKLFAQAEQLVKERNFKDYFLFVERNPFLKDEEIYNRAVMIGDNTLYRLNTYMQEENYDKALEATAYLSDFLHIKETVDKKIGMIKSYQTLIQNIEENNIFESYRCIEEDSTLQTFLPFLTFHEKFIELKEEAHVFAKEGNVEKIMECFDDYFEVKYTMHMVAQEFKHLYLKQIKIYLDASNQSVVNWEETLFAYSAFFGLDNELISMLGLYEFDYVPPSELEKRPLNGYEKIDFIQSVIVLYY